MWNKNKLLRWKNLSLETTKRQNSPLTLVMSQKSVQISVQNSVWYSDEDLNTRQATTGQVLTI